MALQPHEMVFKKGVPPAEGGYPGLNPRTERAAGMIIDYDVAVAMRDGVKIYIERESTSSTREEATTLISSRR